MILPLLKPAEQSCLLYIVRHTVGFVDPNNPERRKDFDVISLEQFENGIVSGPYVQDLGTGLSRQAIRGALEGLEQKGLVSARFACTHCMWQEHPDEPERPIPAEKGRGARCPRCKRTLSRAWGPPVLTPRTVVSFVNQHDKSGRVYSWDADAQRFICQQADGEAQKRQREEDLEGEAERLRGLLWYPALVDKLIADAEGRLKAGRKMSLHRKVNGFYRPVVEMQEQYSSTPDMVAFALRESVRKRVCDRDNNQSWFRYPLAILKNNASKGGPKQGSNAAVAKENSLEEREKTVRDLLQRASDLNDTGDLDAARELLSTILSQAQYLKPLFDGDFERTDSSLREAFKQGKASFLTVKPDSFAPDYYPSWKWPEHLTLNGE